MPVGQTLADILGGLVAINKGDPSGAQAFTGQGRQDLANQRANTRAATELQHQALDVAHVNPEANRYLQEWLQPGLANKQTVAQTGLLGAEAEHQRAAATGQTLQNRGTAQSMESFNPYGGQDFAKFGLEAATTGANVQHARTASNLLAVQADAARQSLLEKRSMDAMAEAYYGPGVTYEAMTDYHKQLLEQQKLETAGTQHQHQVAAEMFGHLYGTPTGEVSDAQRQMAEAGGVHLNESPEAAQRREATQLGLEAARKKLQEKAGGRAQRSQRGLSALIPQGQPAKPQWQPQPGEQQAIPLTQELVKRLYQPPPEELNLHKAMTMLRQLQDLGLMQGGQ